MPRTIHKTEKPVTLEGFQAILAPSKFGYSLSAVVDNDVIDQLENERAEVLKWAESKLKNPKRSTLKPEPWEEVADGKYKIKFSWNEEMKPNFFFTFGQRELERKIERFESCFPSQIREAPNYYSREGIKKWSSYRGFEARSEYAEAFKLIFEQTSYH